MEPTTVECIALWAGLSALAVAVMLQFHAFCEVILTGVLLVGGCILLARVGHPRQWSAGRVAQRCWRWGDNLTTGVSSTICLPGLDPGVFDAGNWSEEITGEHATLSSGSLSCRQLSFSWEEHVWGLAAADGGQELAERFLFQGSRLRWALQNCDMTQNER